PAMLEAPGRLFGKQLRGQVSLAQVWQHHHDYFALVLRLFGHMDSRPGSGARRDTAHQPFVAGQLASDVSGVFVLNLDHVVDYFEVQHIGDEASAESLDGVLARLKRLARPLLRDYGAIDRLDRDHLHAGFASLEHLTHAGDRATGADATDDNID